ncbi:MAG TPA: hypothetical protein VF637_16810 [Sphingomicrobium sp.]|jgi:hypothetical protein
MLSFMLLTAIAAAPAEAPGKTVSISNPANMVPFLQELGYKAKLDLTEEDPSIATGAGGWNYYIHFRGCEAKKDCEDLLVSASWTAEASKE